MPKNHFTKVNIWIAENGDLGKNITYLKMDVEGTELQCLDDWINSGKTLKNDWMIQKYSFNIFRSFPICWTVWDRNAHKICWNENAPKRKIQKVDQVYGRFVKQVQSPFSGIQSK